MAIIFLIVRCTNKPKSLLSLTKKCLDSGNSFSLIQLISVPAKITENTETLADLVSLKLNSDLPKKNLLFASMIALQK